MRYLHLRIIHFLVYLLCNVGQSENKVRTECGILEKTKYRNLNYSPDLKKDGRYTEIKNWKTEAKVVLGFTRLQLCNTSLLSEMLVCQSNVLQTSF